MSIKVSELREEHLGDAAKLVNDRYKALRQELPILPVVYESVDNVVSWLSELIEYPSGVVAFYGERLVGFLAGLVIPEFFGKQAIYSPDWANGVRLVDGRRIYEEMYTQLSRRWVDEGNLIHVVSILSNDHQGNEAWKWLGFGLSGVDAVREIKSLAIDESGIMLKKARIEDLEIVSSLERSLERHMSESPTFWIHDAIDYEGWLKEPGNLVWLAYQRDQAVGYMALEPGENCECSFLRDNKTVNIAGAFTLETERNRGIAAMILNQALRWAQVEGYERCAVDFEAMNVLASRFWMRWFKPVSYSWIRWIDERLRR